MTSEKYMTLAYFWGNYTNRYVVSQMRWIMMLENNEIVANTIGKRALRG
jgi:hypothetical protein